MIEDFNETFDIALALHAVYVPSLPPVHDDFVSWILNGVLQKGHASSDPDESASKTLPCRVRFTASYIRLTVRERDGFRHRERANAESSVCGEPLLHREAQGFDWPGVWNKSPQEQLVEEVHIKDSKPQTLHPRVE